MAAKTLLEDFNELIFNRAFISGNDEVNSDPEYHEKSEEYDKVFNAIRLLLGDSWELLFRLEEVENAISNINIKYSYIRGLKDGIQLKNMLGLDN